MWQKKGDFSETLEGYGNFIHMCKYNIVNTESTVNKVLLLGYRDGGLSISVKFDSDKLGESFKKTSWSKSFC